MHPILGGFTEDRFDSIELHSPRRTSNLFLKINGFAS